MWRTVLLRRHRLVGSTRCGAAFSTLSKEEQVIADMLKTKLNATEVVVQDTSGGCGAMFHIEVTSPIFEGKSTVQQHKLVTKTIEENIANMHGLTIKTRKP